MKYHRSPDGTSLMQSGGTWPPPDGWTEIPQQEYEQKRSEATQQAEQRAAKWLAEQQPTAAS
ncbi:hypothetical protein AB0F92_22730 [Kitasatospora aureofaciens]|uniref:hypothetical protein n=1 Tax=Kitasatospora aureofaciens TaxID=1894 RepID=UPI0009261D57|nr:hypothetical protein CP971_05570 [Streptomyces viridifaciens]UKZ04838.1 hypothetical protein BOQ63_012435 [Streptomyces viridifaciens]